MFFSHPEIPGTPVVAFDCRSLWPVQPAETSHSNVAVVSPMSGPERCAATRLSLVDLGFRTQPLTGSAAVDGRQRRAHWVQ